MQKTTKIIPADMLQQSPWFTKLEPELQQSLLTHGRVFSYGMGETIFAPGMPGGSFYCLLHGTVRMVALSSSGSESLFTIFEPVTWFGDVVIFESIIRKYSAIAQKHSHILLISPSALDDIAQSHPSLWRHVASLMSQKLGLLLLGFEAFHNLNGAGRLAARLVILSSNHDLWTHKKRCTLTISQDDLANMAQLSRSRANTLLRTFERLGILQLRYGQMELINLALLQDIANGTVEVD